MSKVVDVPAVSSAAPVQPAEPSFQETMAKWTPEQRQQWALTGDEPEIATPAKPEDKPAATPEGEVPKVAPEPGPEKDKQEPKSDRSWRKDRKIGELSAELRRAQREIDELRKGARPNAPKTETKPETRVDASAKPVRPEEPDFTAFANIAEYRAAQKDYRQQVSEYEDARDEWNQRQWETKRQQARSEDDQAATEEDFQERLAAAPDKYKDFAETVGSKDLPLSEHAVALIKSRDSGVDVLYYLGKHLEEAKALARLDRDDTLIEYGKIEVALTKAPKPKLISGAPAPGSRVNANTQATGDPIEDAYARGDYALGAKLEAQRDVERRLQRR